MQNTFKVTKNTESYPYVVKKLRLDLEELQYGNVPEDEVRAYVEMILTQIEVLFDNETARYLSCGNPSDMPFDIIVEYVLTPTYIATAILCRAYREYDSVRDIPEIQNTIGLLMQGCMFSHFRGHGFYWVDGLIDAMNIFASGRIHKFVLENSGVNELFEGQFQIAFDFMINDLMKYKNDFGGTYEIEAEQFWLLMDREGMLND